MNNIKFNLLIGTVTFILCVIITVSCRINFFWLAVPLVFIILSAYLSSAMRKRFGRTYGISVYLIILFAIPVLWFVFSANMPITSVMLEARQKMEDLFAFQKYAGSVDAKTEIAQYQMKQDSIVKMQVTALLKEGKVDSALALVKQNDNVSERIKKEIFPVSNPPVSQPENKVIPEPCGQYPEASERFLTINDVLGKTKDQLRVMRNEIFMRHGYIFNSPELATFFSAYKCYSAKNTDVSNLLNPAERYNIEFIKREETMR
ncbi:MAG: YARHG domain-containing protein [Ignavibacteria bacterium]|nr:YARHG domain-containing protein [Ignavibacteria bacterium]